MSRRDHILLTLILGFLGGIVCRSFYELPALFLAAMVVVSACLLFAWSARRHTMLLVQSLVLVAFVFGAARVAIIPPSVSPELGVRVGEQVSFEGVMVADPDRRETSARLFVRSDESLGRAKLLVVADPHTTVSYGDYVRIEGTLVRPEPFETDGGRTFRYDQFLRKDGVGLIVSYAQVERVSGREGVWHQVRGALSDVRFNFMAALGNALPEPHASLASGLLVGGKQGLGDSLLDAFTVAGLVHIVVLSGYNVMIVAESALAALSFMARRAALIVAAVVIGLFVLAAGAGSASIRAGLMAGIALFGRATNRRYDAFRGLLAAGLLMVLYNPLLLAFDPGFQLSFIATAGLIFGVPLIVPKLSFIRHELLRELVATTIAAQIAVLPLLLYQTGMLSLVALFANVLVLPAVPLAMGLSLVAGVLGLLVPFAAPVLAYPAYLSLSYVVAVAEWSSALPFASVGVPAFPFTVVVVAYVLMGFWVMQKARRRPEAFGALPVVTVTKRPQN